ncbi:MAG TPA: hypothetical protein VGM98_20420 [Schlesneria sp.]|jgi:hypothetical protein
MRFHRSFFSLVIALVAIGCGSSGPPRAALSGEVTLDGAPVSEGTIAFLPTADTKGASTGGAIKDGKYSISAANGPTYGKYKVQIRWPKKTGKQIEMGSPAPKGTMIDEVAEAIPPKYNTETTLDKEVKSSKEVFDFKLDK